MLSTIYRSARKLFIMAYRNTEGFLLIIFTFMLVTDVLLGILARFVHFEVVFATELGKYIFIWLCMIGISAAARDNQHVRINFIISRVHINPGLTWVMSQLLFLIFSLFFCIWGIRLTWMHYIMQKSVMGFQFPMYVFTAAIPVGFLLTAVRLSQDIIHILRSSGEKDPWDIPPPADMPGAGDMERPEEPKNNLHT